MKPLLYPHGGWRRNRPPGGRIDVSLLYIEESPGRVEIAVEDRGAGFEAEALENLFTPFFTTREDGTGILESHGGRIRAENRAEGGAGVVVELPVN